MIASIHEHFTASHTSPVCGESRRNALIEEHLDMVPKIVSRTIGRGACRRYMDEYISAGHLGLVQAARTFDPSIGGNFGTYAFSRIRGAVLDEMRRNCFLPVSAYRRLRRLERTRADLTLRLARPPCDEELADALHVSRDDLQETMHVLRGAQYIADDDMDILPLVAGDADRPDEIAQNHETARRLADAIKLLPHQYRVVLHLYYRRGKKMKTIGLRLGLTESRISQICTRGVELLRNLMEEPSPLHANAA